MSSRKINFDALGVTISLACAIHCTILPLAIATLPLLRVNTLFEYVMIAMAFLIGIAALRHGYRKHHHRPAPMLLFACGMIFLTAKQIWHDQEMLLLASALPLLLGAHVWNFRLSRRTRAFS